MQQLIRIRQLLADPSLQVSEQVQPLWSNYGSIIRCFSAKYQKNYIIKIIEPEHASEHPRGWNSSVSHQRKLHSYQIEAAFYCNYSAFTDPNNKVPNLVAYEQGERCSLLIMEDLDDAGYFVRKEQGDWGCLKIAIKWLANFHARFMFNTGENLWPTGTYWHLNTRQDELAAMPESPFKQHAIAIDEALSSAKFQTLLHGDIKFQNLCFHHDGKQVAAVDFQYVGKGSGVKDLAYLIGSCLKADELYELGELALEEYIQQLKLGLQKYNIEIQTLDLEHEVRHLYPVAWADFYRFLLGWNPESWKICGYMENMAQQGLDNLGLM
mgnify:CR=1 FL=1